MRHLDKIKQHQGWIKEVIEDRTKDYLDRIVDEPDPQKKEVLCLMVKEFRMALTAINNLNNTKEKKKPDEQFTGV